MQMIKDLNLDDGGLVLMLQAADKARSPEVRKMLNRALKRVEALVKRRAPYKDVYREFDSLTERSKEAETEDVPEDVPADTEASIRRWMRGLEIRLREVG